MKLEATMTEAGRQLVRDLHQKREPAGVRMLSEHMNEESIASLLGHGRFSVGDEFMIGLTLAEIHPGSPRQRALLFHSAAITAWIPGAYEDALEAFARAQRLAPTARRRTLMKKIEQSWLALKNGPAR